MDLALVGQSDGCQLAVLVAVALGAAIRVLVALQLAVGVEALPCLVAEAGFCGVCAAVGGFAALDAALLVSSVAGAADEAALCVALFVGRELAGRVALVAGAFVQRLVCFFVFFPCDAACGVIGVVAGVSCRVLPFGELAGRVVGVARLFAP